MKTVAYATYADIDDEADERLNNLVNAIISLENETVKKLEAILLYLRDKTYAADINELKNAWRNKKRSTNKF